MLKRKFQFLLTGLLPCLFAFAGVNDKGVEYYNAGLTDAAKEFFVKQKTASATDEAEKNYYLGLIYDNEKSDSAQYFFRQAVAADAKSPYGYIGMGRIELKNDNPKGAETQFKAAEKLAKKDAAVQVNIAKAYFDYDKTADAENALAKAHKINMEYSGIYLLEGDMKTKAKDYSNATSKYENALYFNANDKLAYIKLARIYDMNRKDMALDYINQVLKIDPNYIPAYIILGDIKNSQAKSKEAIEAYEKVIAIGNVPTTVYERYAQALYFDRQYAKSLEQIKKTIQDNTNNVIMRRLEAYNEYELENYADGLVKMQKFISTTQPKDIIYLDYMTMARYYVKAKNYPQSIENFQKAIALNDRQPEAYKEIANAYCMSFEYAKSIPNFEKYFEMNPNYLNMDLYVYSDACINSAGKSVDAYNKNFTPEQLAANDREFMDCINKAIATNDSLIKRAPESYLGFYGKAKAYSWIDAYEKKKTDKIDGVAKPYYDEAVMKLEAGNTDGKLNAYVIDAYRYYSGYYIMKDDVKNTIEINKKILDIDPNDSRAIEILKALKVKLPKKK
ncbi:MAG: hypothetical protein LBT04_01860 [Prevotellaceae bacterium]|jgi:tetratricopeptide (TPR) repeat protein|nr:hypothetical protein [Prevotellaceae bacterium]